MRMPRKRLIVNRKMITWIICWTLLVQLLTCSEFPERECCDPIYPIDPEPLPPALPTTTISSSSASSSAAVAGRSGEFYSRIRQCQ